MNKECTCKMGFSISWDEADFFFRSGIGSANHNDHAHLHQIDIRFPTWLLEISERSVVESCGKANGLNSVLFALPKTA
jgi:hypothetical protein